MNAQEILQKSVDDISQEEWLFLENEWIVNGCWAGSKWIVRERNFVIRWLLRIISLVLSKFKPPLAVFFRASCSKHDKGYAQGWDEARRKHCDDIFLSYMITDIFHAIDTGKISEGELAYYTEWALRYHTAVRSLGWSRFNYSVTLSLYGSETSHRQ